jgi:YndJ-like protein
MSTSLGLGAALTLAAIILVPLGLRRVRAVMEPARAGLDFAQAVSLPAGVLIGIALILPPGPLAAGLSLPWLAVGAVTALAAVLDTVGQPRPHGRDVHHAESAAQAYLAVAPCFALADRLAIAPLGIDPLIVRLTAIHFVFAGFVLPLVGAALWRRRQARSLELSLGAIVIGIPLTALGFLGLPVANWVGALLVAGGGCGVGLAAATAAGSFRDVIGRWLMRVAGGSLLLAMPLGALYATGLVLGLAWVDIPTMARIHGTLNAVGFGVPSLVALALESRWTARSSAVAVQAG